MEQPIFQRSFQRSPPAKSHGPIPVQHRWNRPRIALRIVGALPSCQAGLIDRLCGACEHSRPSTSNWTLDSLQVSSQPLPVTSPTRLPINDLVTTHPLPLTLYLRVQISQFSSPTEYSLALNCDQRPPLHDPSLGATPAYYCDNGFHGDVDQGSCILHAKCFFLYPTRFRLCSLVVSGLDIDCFLVRVQVLQGKGHCLPPQAVSIPQPRWTESHLVASTNTNSIATDHGFSSPFTPLLSSCGTIAWVR